MQTFQILAVLSVIGVAVTLASHHGYNFEYGVKDPHTGDIKSQSEKSHGGHVTGYYKLKEADGTERIVHYSADKHNGFTAHVERNGHAYHPEHYHHGHGHGYGHGNGYGHGHSHASSYQNFNLDQDHHDGNGYSHGHGHASSYQNFNLEQDHHGHY